MLLSRPSDADKGKVQAKKRDTEMEILVLGTFSPIDAVLYFAQNPVQGFLDQSVQCKD